MDSQCVLLGKGKHECLLDKLSRKEGQEENSPFFTWHWEDLSRDTTSRILKGQ